MFASRRPLVPGAICLLVAAALSACGGAELAGTTNASAKEPSTSVSLPATTGPTSTTAAHSKGEPSKPVAGQPVSDSAPRTAEGVWVWAPATKAGPRLLSVNSAGGLDLKRSSTKQSKNSLFHHELTLVPAGTTSENKDPGQYQIMSPEDSEEINSYCVSAGGANGFELKVCRKSAVEQRFTLARMKGGYTIFSQYWSGWLIAAGRTVDWSADEAATVFTLHDVPQN
jgi:hypothetical protein